MIVELSLAFHCLRIVLKFYASVTFWKNHLAWPLEYESYPKEFHQKVLAVCSRSKDHFPFVSSSVFLFRPLAHEVAFERQPLQNLEGNT